MLPNSEKVFFAQKVGFAFSQPGWIDQFFKNEKERALAVAILKLPDAMHAVVQDLLPSRLCDYAYTLCVAYNEFYSVCKVIGSPEEKSRLMLCRATVFSLRRALFVLGITPLYRL